MNDTHIYAHIPQRPPFVMIDELIQTDGSQTVTRFQIPEEHLFVADGVFTEPGLIENMAQTAAAGTGFMAQANGTSAPVGFIGALKGLVITDLPKAGTVIETRTNILHTIGNAHIAEGVIASKGKEIARCEFKIFIQAEA